SGACINLSHGIARHPARMHAGGCSPYVGDMVGSPNVSSRIKLNIVSALRCVLEKGADARVGDVVDHFGLLLGFDPAAVDATAVVVLQSERRRRSIPHDLRVRYLENMEGRGLGRTRLEDIDQVVRELD